LADGAVSAARASAALERRLVLEPAARTAAAMVESLRKRRRGRWDMVESLVDGKKV